MNEPDLHKIKITFEHHLLHFMRGYLYMDNKAAIPSRLNKYIEWMASVCMLETVKLISQYEIELESKDDP